MISRPIQVALIACVSVSCHAVGDFPERPDFISNRDAEMDMRNAELDLGDAAIFPSDADEAPDTPLDATQQPDEGFVPGLNVEFCDTNGALKARPRVGVAGVVGAGAAVWVSPQDNAAQIENIGGDLGTTYTYPDTQLGEPDLDSATSVDIGLDLDSENIPLFFSVTRRYSETSGIALYPKIICAGAMCDSSDLLWSTAVTSTRNTLFDSVRVNQIEEWFWLGTDGDFVTLNMINRNGTPDDQDTTNFCRSNESDCVQPGPLEADASGTPFSLVFVRAGDGKARAWGRNQQPAPVLIDGAPVLYDDFSALGAFQSDSEQRFYISHIDRERGVIDTYQASGDRDNLLTRIVPDSEPVATLTEDDVWRAKIVGSGDSVWHLITMTRDGQLQAYLYEPSSGFEAVFPEKIQLDMPAGELINWNVSASPLQADLTMDASLYIALIGGDDECNVDVTTLKLSVRREPR